jgi:hypothetical protein
MLTGLQGRQVMIDIIRAAWGWTGLEPIEVVARNEFGNLIVCGADGTYWRICPEELSCEQIAPNAEEFARVAASEEFRIDWEMEPLVQLARKKLGPPGKGECYCLKVPAVIGGQYDASNLGLISQDELVSFSGDMACQIKDVPDGEKVHINIVNLRRHH